MTSADEIRAKVTDVLVHSLGVDEDEITPSTTLMADLGAESIDFLDIVFRLERGFQIKIPRGELFIEPMLQSGPEIVQDGRVTEDGLRALRSQMPFADLTGLEQHRRLGAVTDLFTVDLLVRYVTWKLRGNETTGDGDRPAVPAFPGGGSPVSNPDHPQSLPHLQSGPVR